MKWNSMKPLTSAKYNRNISDDKIINFLICLLSRSNFHFEDKHAVRVFIVVGCRCIRFKMLKYAS